MPSRRRSTATPWGSSTACPPASSRGPWLSASRRAAAPSSSTPGRWRRLLPAMGYAVAAAVPVTALALVAREQVGAVIQLDRNAIAAATDITRANPGLYTALVWWQEALQPRWVYIVGTGV